MNAHRTADMIGKLVAEVATRCGAEPGDLCAAAGDRLPALLSGAKVRVDRELVRYDLLMRSARASEEPGAPPCPSLGAGIHCRSEYTCRPLS
jgi:hypothetical protein